jgi:hypothetical protein
MKRFIAIILTLQIMLILSYKLFSQSSSDMQEFGTTAGAFTNFPANKDYLKKDIKVFYIAPYLRTGKHEFSAGIVYPLQTHGLFFTDNNINPCIGAIAGYKFYVFNVFGRENLFVHYAFQYLRFKGDKDLYINPDNQPVTMTETDVYINNVIGLGYNIFFDTDERFGFFYTLDYVISQTSYKTGTTGFKDNSWTTQYIWNNLSTNLGLSFKLTSLKKKEKR